MYTNIIINTNQEPVIDMKRKKRKESKHINKEGHKTTREEDQEKKGTEKDYKKTILKMAKYTYLSIIALNVNGLNASIKKNTENEWIKNKTNLYVV